MLLAFARVVALALVCGLFGCTSGSQFDHVTTDPRVHGRVEHHGGLKVLRLWGTPQERGHAHGVLLGADFAAVALPEFTARFARQQPLLEQARAAVKRLIEYPEDVQQELQGLWQGLVESRVSLRMDELDRSFDFTDLLVANALDVFGLMGCSSFTVWGQQAEGGGVLSARNFDWPFTGEHLLKHTVVVVTHLPGGRAVAAVTWPGYLGAVTGVNSDGMAAFLHVGSAKITFTPEPSSWPSALAVRAILASEAKADARTTFAAAQKVLEFTSPPAGYITHVALPTTAVDGSPAVVFETDADSCVEGERQASALVLTNHFRTRTDGRKASKDSLDREQRVQTGLRGCIDIGDHVVSPAEAWQLLASVQRGGGHAFGTLHALVFRHEPWCFQLRIAELGPKGVVAAPAVSKLHELTRQQLFALGESFGK